MDQAAETAEQLTDRHHAYEHHGIAQLRSEPFDFLGDRAKGHVDGRRRDLLEPRLGDHQLANLVEKFVQACGGNPNRFICHRQAGFELLGRDGLVAFLAALRQHSNVTDLRHRDRLQRGFGRSGLFNFLDLKRHVVDDEDKDVFDRRARLLRLEGHLPGKMALGRHQCRQFRNAVCDGDHICFAEAAQLVEQRQGARTVDEAVGWQSKADAPGLGSRRSRGTERTFRFHRLAQAGE